MTDPTTLAAHRTATVEVLDECYANPLAGADDIAGWRMEGPGVTSFPRERLRLESTVERDEQRNGNFVLWCPEALPDAVVALDAIALRDGRVLVTGGQIRSGVGTARAHVFDPATGAWAEVGVIMFVHVITVFATILGKLMPAPLFIVMVI